MKRVVWQFNRVLSVMLAVAMVVTMVPQTGISVSAAELTEEVTSLEGEQTPEEAEATETPEEENAEPSVTPEETTAPTPSEVPEESETPTAAPSEAPEKSETPTATPSEVPEATASAEPSVLPEETEAPSETPMVTETPTATILPVVPGNEIKTEKIEAEGIYQEGAFSMPEEADAQIESVDLSEAAGYEAAEEYVYRQLLKKAASIDMTSYSVAVADIGKFWAGIINEHPDLYYVSGGCHYSYSTAKKVTKITPIYLSGFDNDAFKTATEKALSVIEDGMSDLEIAVALHDYLAVNCAYAYEDYLNDTLDNNVYTSYGVLVERSAVCQGYALAYKYLLNKAGITCYMVTSDAMCHAWNLIELNGEYYQVDVTWDDPVWNLTGRATHNYMLVSDEEFENGRTSLHYSWEVTKGSEVVNLVADDTTYDDAFWVGVKAPLILYEDEYYYIASDGRIVKTDMETGVTTQIASKIGNWKVTDQAEYYWREAYSGFFRIGERLYYNTPERIYSISINGGSARVETDVLADTSKNNYVYGSTYVGGQVEYCLHSSPSLSETETVYTTELLNQPQGAEEITLNKTSLTMKKGEIFTLTAQKSPADSDLDLNKIVWSSSKTSVATVSDGVVKAVGEGRCTITASVDGISATCTVEVLEQLQKPVFSPKSSTGSATELIAGNKVTLTAETGATIYYTTDGKTPSSASTKYTGPITLEKDTYIKAIAVKEGFVDSDVAEGNYVVYAKWPFAAGKVSEITLLVGQTSLAADISANKNPSYSVEDSSVATINAQGVIEAKKAGTTKVRATAGTERYLCIVTVRDIYMSPSTIQVNKDDAVEVSLKERKTVNGNTVTQTVLESVIWKISDTNIASMVKKENGLVEITGVNGGTTSVSATIGSKNDSAWNQVLITQEVTVEVPLTGISLDNETLTLGVGGEETITAYAVPLDTTEDCKIKWESNDSKVVELISEEEGSVAIKALKTGSAVITASLMVGSEVRDTATCNVTVYEEAELTVAPIYVLTNEAPTLNKVSLPKNFSWKGNAAQIKLSASEEKQQYIAVYKYPNTEVTQEVVVDVYVGTITGIKVEGDSFLEPGTDCSGQITVKPVYKGIIEGNHFKYKKPAVKQDGYVKMAESGTSESGEMNYNVTALKAATGKKVEITFTTYLEDSDLSKKQKGKTWFETKYVLSVAKSGMHAAETIDFVTDDLVIETKEGRDVIIIDASVLKTDAASFALKTQVKNKAGTDISDDTPLIYKIDRTSVASIDKNGVVKCKTVGTALITVTSKDGAGAKVEIGLEVRDYHPKMAQTELNMNLAYNEGVEGRLRVAEGSTLSTDKFTLTMYDSKKKTYVDAAKYFKLVRRGSDFILTPGEALTVKNGKKVTYQLSIGTKVKVGTQTKTFSGANGNVVKVVVSNSLPKVSVKQSSKLNMFYTDSETEAVLSVSDATITKVEWKDVSQTDFRIRVEEKENGKATLIVEAKRKITSAKSPVNNGVLKVWLKEYDTPVEVTYKVATEYKKPFVATKDSALKWMPSVGINSAETVLRDKSTGQPIDLTGVTLAISSGYKIEKASAQAGKIAITAVATAGKSATITMTDTSFREKITVPVKFLEAKPTAILSAKSVTLSNKYTIDKYEPYTITVNASEKVDAVTITSVQAADKKTQQLMDDDLLSVKIQNNKLMFGLQTVKKNGKKTVAGKGSYALTVAAKAAITLNGKTVYQTLVPVKVTVKVVDKAASISLSGSTKLNLLDRSGAGVMTFTPKISNSSVTIKNVKLAGAYAGWFTTTVDSSGKIKLQAKEDADFAVKRTYPVTPVYTLSDGSVVTGPVINVQTIYPTVRFTVAEKNITFFRSVRGEKSGEKVTVSATISGSQFKGDERIESITSATEGFVYKNGMLCLDDAYKLPTKGSATVNLRVTLKGQAKQGTQFNYKVKVLVKE